MARKLSPEPIDLDGRLSELVQELRHAQAAIVALADQRRAAVLDGDPDTVLDIERRHAPERVKVEQCEARIAVVRQAIAERDAEASAAEKRRAYEAAKAVRDDGVEAITAIQGLLPQLASARARLIAAKTAVGNANRALPPGASRLIDPEGERIESCRASSILDQVRFAWLPGGAS